MTYHHPFLVITFQLLCHHRSVHHTWTVPPQHSGWKEQGKTVSDRSSRKNGHEITHQAASWKHRGQCCPASSYGGQGQGDPRNILGVIVEWTRMKTTSTPLPHNTTSCLISTLELTSHIAVNSCGRTVTLTRINMFHFVKSWNHEMYNI